MAAAITNAAYCTSGRSDRSGDQESEYLGHVPKFERPPEPTFEQKAREKDLTHIHESESTCKPGAFADHEIDDYGSD